MRYCTEVYRILEFFGVMLMITALSVSIFSWVIWKDGYDRTKEQKKDDS